MHRIIFLLMSLTLVVLWPNPGQAVDESRPCTREPTNMPIACGDVIACDLSTGVDSDSFPFDGTEGDTVRIQVTNPGDWLINPCIELFDPEGALVDSACGGFATGLWNVRLGKSGRWRIVLSEKDLALAGPYTLSLACLAPVARPASPIAFDADPPPHGHA